MTITDFARLCGCNPQTLRYYDRVALLRPARVDPWSGYRYYDEEQALDFVKIKNLQTAGFSIEEIKALLPMKNERIIAAFERKIAEQQERLEQIKTIQQSYLNEMRQMEEKLREARKAVARAMEGYDPREEFGIDQATYEEITGSVDHYFDDLLSSGQYDRFKMNEDEEQLALTSPDYEIVYEKHGWQHVKDFLHECSTLPDGAGYGLRFELLPGKADHTAFANVALSLLIRANAPKRRSLELHVTDSADGQNHFWLMRRK